MNSIEKNGKYEMDSTIIIKWEKNENKNSEMFIIKIGEKTNKEKIIFLGIVNSNFKREGICINNYLNRRGRYRVRCALFPNIVSLPRLCI